MDYKDTLLMPKTSFEMRGNLTKKEPAMVEKWEKENQYAKLLAAHEGEPTFMLHDGPPYANGNLHAGTAMNRVNTLWQVMLHHSSQVGIRMVYQLKTLFRN